MTTLLADYHHHDLWESLELLCERLGWTLYRPIGMDWFEEGYWNLERAWHGDAVARQYLTPWGDDIPPTYTEKPIEWVSGKRFDKSHGRYQNLVTLEQARYLKPDIVLSTVAHNHEGMARFASEVGATFGLQIGNVRFSEIDMREDRWDLAKFGLVSAVLPAAVDVPTVTYHQEFSLTDFRYEPPSREHEFRISSFVNCFPENLNAYEDWKAVAPRLPEYDWRVYGAYGQVPEDQYAAGNLSVCAAVGDAMRASDVAWHTKQWSDGYGHVIHDWFAVGRPVIGHEWYYRNQLAGPLWQEGVTSFDISDKSVDYVIGIIKGLAEDGEFHERMCRAAAARFREIVSFDEEEQAIRAMFSRVLP